MRRSRTYVLEPTSRDCVQGFGWQLSLKIGEGEVDSFMRQCPDYSPSNFISFTEFLVRALVVHVLSV